MVAIAGHPYLAIPAAMGAESSPASSPPLLQTKMGIDSLLAGIIVNTGLYSINIAVMGGSSLLNMNKTETVFIKPGLCCRAPSWLSSISCLWRPSP